MKVLAHRGWWQSSQEKNSEVAIRRALDGGFGLETDLRDQGGEVVISHDVPSAKAMLFSDFVGICNEYNHEMPIALNVKSDGLQKLIYPIVSQLKRPSFFFDMSVPDTLGYVRNGLPVFTRESEYEPHPALYSEAEGVWMDAFLDDWISTASIQKHINAGKKVCLVSPELHSRPYESVWDSWQPIRQEQVMICTDYPDLAEKYWK